MNLAAPFLALFERRSIRLPNGFKTVSELLGIERTSAGIDVTPEKAITVPAVFSCFSVLSQDVAKTPTKMRRKIAPDTYVDAIEHDLWEILFALANPETTSYDLKREMQFDLLQFERAYAEI